MNADVEAALKKAKADLLDGMLEACRDYAETRVGHGARREQVNAEFEALVPKFEAFRKKGVEALNATAASFRPKSAISGPRLAAVHLRIALRKLQEEERVGRPLEIEQIDVDIQDDNSGMYMWVYPGGAQEFVINVPLPPAEVATFRRHAWKKAMAPWITAEDNQ